MMMTKQPFFIDAQAAFSAAIASGHLSADRGDDNWAGNFMYMHSTDEGDSFKHRETRKYMLATNVAREEELTRQSRAAWAELDRPDSVYMIV